MRDDREAVAFDRRSLIVGTAGAVATLGIGGSYARAATLGATASRNSLSVLPTPKPLPGGLDLPPLIHLFLPGDGVTLPFSQTPTFGLDVEPTTITDFRGFTAQAYVIGSAKGSDGQTYDMEVDLRVSKGQYVAADGSRNEGAFALI